MVALGGGGTGGVCVMAVRWCYRLLAAAVDSPDTFALGWSKYR